MLTSFISTIFSFIVGILIIHFIGLKISSVVRKKWGTGLFRNDMFNISADGQKDLMVVMNHYNKLWCEDFDFKFTHAIDFIIGGFSFTFRYGHDYYEADPDGDNDYSSKYYGLYSVDGEYFWREFCWGIKRWDNPFKATKFLGCWVYDVYNYKMTPLNKLREYSDDYDPNIKFPYLFVVKDTTYTDKAGETYPVEEIRWWLEERRWTTLFMSKIGLGRFFQLKRVDLAFESKTELGVKRDSWKGGVIGGDIWLNQYPELYKTYNLITEKDYRNLTNKFRLTLRELTNNFMSKDRKY